MEQKDILYIKERLKQTRISAMAQCKSSGRKEKLNYILGVPVVVLTTFVGTSVFASINGNGNKDILIATGIISVLAAILASLQTFLRYSDKAQQHHKAAVKYGAIKKRLEHLLNFPPNDKDELKEIIRQIELDYDVLRSDAPNTPDSIWKKINEQYEEDKFIEELSGFLEKEKV